jgi:hypothetical protein
LASALPTAPCVIGYGAGGQAVLGGFSFSGGKVDKNCAILETARSFANFGSDIAYCKTMLTDRFAIKAGVTMQDCLATRKTVVIQQPASIVPVQEPPQIILNVPAPVVQAPPIPELPPAREDVTSLTEIGSCNIFNGINNVCKRIADNAILALQSNPGAQLILRGPHQGAEILTYLRSRGVSSAHVRMSFEDEANWSLNFELFQVSQ